MHGEVYRRPLLCRLCECPVVDRGVRLYKHHLDRLSRWWKAHWDTDLEQKSCVVCHFCVWDLRFAELHSDEKEPADQIWWPTYDQHKNAHYNNDQYYKDGWMKPCSVKLTPLANEEKLLDENRSRKGFSQRQQCLFCPKNYATLHSLISHIKTIHPDTFFYCTKKNCGKFFHTEEEKAEHTEKDHQSTKDEPQKCIYCAKVSTNKAKHAYHLLKHHKGQVIRCKHGSCFQMFKTKGERDKHFEDLHNSGKFFCCFCCRYFQSSQALRLHIKKHHKGAIKCNAPGGCPNYFKTEEELQKHVQEKHSKEYKCIYCALSYGKKGFLSKHVKDFHKDVAFKCEYTQMCGAFFKTEEKRQKHYKEKHESGNNKTMCPICKKMFLKSKTIGQHIRTHHKKEKIIKCDYTFYCATYFSCEEDKLKHVQEVHENLDEKFRCVYCDKIIPKKMYHHIMRWHKDVAIKCSKEKCPTYFKTLEDRDKHVREVHQVERIREKTPCLYCDTILTGKHLSSHMNLKHSEIAIKCKFPNCGTYFKSTEDLEEHFSLKPKHKNFVKKEPEVNRFECALCQKAFYHKSQVKYHIISKHKRTKEMCPHCKKTTSKPYHNLSDFCKVCNKKFPCIGLLKSHNLKCKPIFQCPVCAKSFNMECELNFHCRRNHTAYILKWKGLENKSRCFKCDECLVYFSSNNHLQKHNRVSHGLTIFTCDFCQKKFSSKEKLKNHLSRYHLGLIKIFHCPICNLKLTNKLGLKEHTATHFNQDKVISCEICAKMMKSSGLKVHLRRMH